MQRRMLDLTDFETRETESGEMILSGYFAKFDSPYEVCDGWTETIAPGAFTRTLASGSEVKGLWNHDTNLALGSLLNRTLVLVQDDIGLRGDIVINPLDSDAVNGYQRVKRGDVSGCSIGFEVTDLDEEYSADGHRHTILREIFPLYEVSPCTFPSYEATEVYARNREAFEKDKKSRALAFEKWRVDILRRIKK